MAGNLTVGHLLAAGIDRLKRAGTGTGLDAELLLAHCLASTRAQIRSHPERTPAPDQSLRYRAVIKRRAAGEPVAYILGNKDFWTLNLAVSPAVLVPRPETELLVERALALELPRQAKAADLGTGCGAIALALASERPPWTLTATDASANALAVAKSNALRLGLQRVEFVLGDWFEPLAGRRFHLILSNPPYVDAADPALLEPALTYEPRSALTPGEDGLADLSAIISSAPRYLERLGWLLLEHGTNQAARVASELVVRGFRHVTSHRDLAGHERMTEGQWLADDFPGA
jgi:release factor glutamine methyltransferase